MINKYTLSLAAAAAMFAHASYAQAQCCPGYSPATACANANLTKSRWCVQDGVPGGAGVLPAAFCPYGDAVVSALESVFAIPAPSTFEFEVDLATGGAHTGTACSNLGDGVGYDSFDSSSNSSYGGNTNGWGYLLALHEGINDWTGMASGGWPTDWWADHISAFPNMMDFHIMDYIGTAQNNTILTSTAAYHKKRFYPGGSNSDPRVVAVDNVYNMMPNMDGLAGYAHMFAMITGDGRTDWGDLGTNPNQKLSEYVVAYMGLAVGQQGGAVLKTVQGPSANMGGNICNGFNDGQGDPTYMCSQANVDAIATAHCALHANGMDAADKTALEMGNFANVAMGPCGSTCPAECGCDMSTMHCVAPWVAMNGGSSGGTDGGTGSGSSSGGGDAGSSGSSGSTSSSGTSSSTGGSGSSAGSSGTSSSGSSGSGTSSTGSGSSTSGSGASSASGSGSGGTGSSGGSSGNGTMPGGIPGPSARSTGCSCGVAGGGGSWSAALAISALAAAMAGRTRRRRP